MKCPQDNGVRLAEASRTMRSATLISILFVVGCASGTSSPSTSPATPDASGSVGASADGGPSAADAGGPGFDAGPADAGGPGIDAGPADAGGPGIDAGPADAGGSADAGTPLDGGSADAGTTAAAHCDPALDPAAGLALGATSTSASCAGLTPAVPSCASEIAACSGWHNGSGGPTGTTTTRGDSDGAGTIALACANVDLGPSPGFTLFLDGAAGYTKGVHLGDNVWGLPSGMVALTTSYAQRPSPYYDFVTHQGALLGNVAQGPGRIYVSAATIEIVTPEPAPGGVQIFAQQVDVDGSPRGTRLSTKALRRCGQLDRQSLLVEDLAAMH